MINIARSCLLILVFLIPLFSYAGAVGDTLVAHWKLDEIAGATIHDQSPNGFHGILQNTTFTDGPLNGGLEFNGNAAVFFPKADSAPPQTIASLDHGTIMLWFTFRDFSGEMLPLFYFGESESGTPHNSLIIEIGHGNVTNRRLYFTIVNASFCFDSKVNLDSNRWYHFAAVVSENGNTGYLNGQEMTNRNYNLGSNSTYSDFFSSVPRNEMLSLGYGRYGKNDNFWYHKGKIDDVRIYNTALKSAEILKIYNEGTATIISSSDRDANFQVCPNPAGDHIDFRLPAPFSQAMTGYVYGIEGKVLTQFELEEGSSFHPLSTANLKPGLYMLKIGNYQSSFVKK